MTMRIGAGAIGWFEDDFSEFRNDIAREAHLLAIARAGFDGVCLNPGTAREVAAVRGALGRHRLQFIAPTHAISLVKSSEVAALPDLKLPLRVAHSLGATLMTVCDRSTIDMTDADWNRFTERLSALGAAFAAAGIHLVYRPAAGTIVGSAEMVDRVMAATDATVGLMLDASVIGDQTVTIARRHADRIKVVAPGTATDAVMAALPQFDGWTMCDEAAIGQLAKRPEFADFARAA